MVNFPTFFFFLRIALTRTYALAMQAVAYSQQEQWENQVFYK